MVGSHFFSLGDSQTKGLLVLLHLGLEGITEAETHPKGRFVFFKVLPITTKFPVFLPIHGIEPGNSWLGGISLKEYKIKWKIEMKELKTK